MRKPKAILLESANTIQTARIELIGLFPESLPYISFGLGGSNAYLKDKDVKRLRRWCDECLKPRRRKRAQK